MRNKKCFFLALLAIIVIGIGIYSNTFHSPFEFDSRSSILKNTSIHSLKNIQAIWNYSHTRFLTYLSFAVNYHFGGKNVFGYHLINIIIHLLNTFVLWGFVVLLLSCPGLEIKNLSKHKYLIGFISCLIFLVHPIQTQAVTYIVQRATSLAALFYLLTLFLYLKSKFSSGKKKKTYYVFSLITAVLSMFTKENCFTLPVTLCLIDILGFPEIPVKERIKYLLPFFLTLFIIPLCFALPRKTINIGELGRIAEPVGKITPLHYLFTQFRVLITYLRLFFIPVNQNLDYDYPIYHTFFTFPVFGSFLLLLAIAISGYYYFFKKGYKIVGLAILWFFITLAVESSVFPISDVIFEHRLYLPIVSYCLLIGIIAGWLIKKVPKGFVISFLVVILSFYSILTIKRNQVWRSSIKLWLDTAEKSPDKARPHNNLGVAYGHNEKHQNALSEFKKALKIDPHYFYSYFNRGALYGKMKEHKKAIKDFSVFLKDSSNKSFTSSAFGYRGKSYFAIGKYAPAISDFKKALKLKDEPSADIYCGLAMAYLAKTDFKKALENFEKAIEINPELAAAYSGIGVILFQQKEYDKAITQFKKALEINPELSEASEKYKTVLAEKEKQEKNVKKLVGITHFNKGNNYRRKGEFENAIKEYTLAIKHNPEYYLAFYNRGRAYQNMGKYEESLKNYADTIKINPEYAESYNSRGFIYDRLNRLDKAISDYTNAIKINPEYAEAYNNRGNAFFKERNFEEAISNYTNALEINSNFIQSYRNRGIAYAKIRETGKAVSDFRKYLELNPSDPKALSLQRYIQKYSDLKSE